MVIAMPITLIMLPIQIYILIKYAYNYDIFPIVIVGFTISTIFIILSAVYGILLISISLKSVKYYSLIIISAAVLNICLNAYFIPKYFLSGAILATMITSFIQAALIFNSTAKSLRSGVF